jgi:hypothetical protein
MTYITASALIINYSQAVVFHLPNKTNRVPSNFTNHTGGRHTLIYCTGTVLDSLAVFFLFSSSSFKKVRIEKESSAHEHALLVCSSNLRKIKFKRIGVSQELSEETLGLLNNHANVWRIAIRIFLIGRKKAERLLAESLAARISFRAAIDTEPTAAGWRVDLVNLGTSVVTNLEGRNTA